MPTLQYFGFWPASHPNRSGANMPPLPASAWHHDQTLALVARTCRFQWLFATPLKKLRSLSRSNQCLGTLKADRSLGNGATSPLCIACHILIRPRWRPGLPLLKELEHLKLSGVGCRRTASSSSRSSSTLKHLAIPSPQRWPRIP